MVPPCVTTALVLYINMRYNLLVLEGHLHADRDTNQQSNKKTLFPWLVDLKYRHNWSQSSWRRHPKPKIKFGPGPHWRFSKCVQSLRFLSVTSWQQKNVASVKQSRTLCSAPPFNLWTKVRIRPCQFFCAYFFISIILWTCGALMWIVRSKKKDA